MGASQLKTGALWMVLGVWKNGWENKAGGDVQMSTLTPFPSKIHRRTPFPLFFSFDRDRQEING